MSEVCTIVLNWNRWRDTVECLESLVLLKPSIKTIIVCDNGSSDGSREKILSWAEKRYEACSILVLKGGSRIQQRPSIYPFIYIQNQANLGYAGGNNAGIRIALSRSCFDFIWVLNNDTLVHKNAIEAFLACEKDHPNIGIFGSTIAFAGQPKTLQCAGGCRYNPLTTIYRPALGGKNIEEVLQENNSPMLDYIYGASMFVRTEVFEKIGLFSEEYFLFYEELDLCHRAKQAGFGIGWCKKSIVYHKSSRTIGWPGLAEKGKIALANYHENLSTLIFTKKFYPAFFPFAMVFRFFGKLAFILKRRDRHLILPLLLAYRDFLRRVAFDKRPHYGTQDRNIERGFEIVKTDPRIKLLVNAIPMVNVNTGISRYLRSLYAEIERLYGDKLEIGYFDGMKVSSTMPHGPANLNRWVRNVDLFWEVPVYPALMVRLTFHAIRETLFRQCSRQFELYHEAGFFPFAVPHQLKTVFTICDLSLMLFPQNHPRERVFYSRIFFGRRCKKVDYFLTISNHIAKEMQAILNIDPEMISVTPLAYDDKVFSPKSREQIAAFLKRYALPERYFLFVGSGDPRKNLDVIPEALENAGLKIPLVVAGWSGWSDDKSSKNVIPLGYVSDDELARAYSGALGLIFPSSYEGFGLPIVEAMACGCPVVTTREASLPDVAGDAALYLNEARNRAELGHLLNKLATSSAIRTELSLKGRIQAEKFSWEKTAQATFQVFLEVLKK